MFGAMFSQVTDPFSHHMHRPLCKQMAEFDGANKVKVGSDEYTADHILIAVGGTPSFPPIEGKIFQSSPQRCET